MQHAIVHIENAYEDGHESAQIVLVSAPDSVLFVDELEQWFEDKVFPFTGDGHGENGMGSCYTATLWKASGDLNRFAGYEKEWID